MAIFFNCKKKNEHPEQETASERARVLYTEIKNCITDAVNKAVEDGIKLEEVNDEEGRRFIISSTFKKEELITVNGVKKILPKMELFMKTEIEVETRVVRNFLLKTFRSAEKGSVAAKVTYDINFPVFLGCKFLGYYSCYTKDAEVLGSGHKEHQKLFVNERTGECLMMEEIENKPLSGKKVILDYEPTMKTAIHLT
jgi:hypothetical protein